LLGRGATDEELSEFVGILESDNFSMETRKSFIERLQQDDSLQEQYHTKVFVDMKARYLDAINDADILQEANLWLSQAIQANALGDALAAELLMQEYNKTMTVSTMATTWEDSPIDYPAKGFSPESNLFLGRCVLVCFCVSLIRGITFIPLETS
jgi:hypothetical protein